MPPPAPASEEEETASAPAAMDEDQEDEDGASAAASSSNKTPEFEPPLSSVTKVIRRAVGESVQVGKEAKATFTRAAGIFILYVTACANDFSREGKRATITANDIYLALRELDFEEFIEPLKGFLKKEQEQKKAKAESKAADKAARTQEEEGEGDGEESGAEKNDDVGIWSSLLPTTLFAVACTHALHISTNQYRRPCRRTTSRMRTWSRPRTRRRKKQQEAAAQQQPRRLPRRRPLPRTRTEATGLDFLLFRCQGEEEEDLGEEMAPHQEVL